MPGVMRVTQRNAGDSPFFSKFLQLSLLRKRTPSQRRESLSFAVTGNVIEIKVNLDRVALFDLRLLCSGDVFGFGLFSQVHSRVAKVRSFLSTVYDFCRVENGARERAARVVQMSNRVHGCDEELSQMEPGWS